jgi:hypothetical protein
MHVRFLRVHFPVKYQVLYIVYFLQAASLFVPSIKFPIKCQVHKLTTLLFVPVTVDAECSSAGMTTAGTTPAAGGGATTGTFSPGFGAGGANGTGVGSGSSLGPTGMGAGSFDAAAPGLLPCVQLAAFLAILSSFLVL